MRDAAEASRSFLDSVQRQHLICQLIGQGGHAAKVHMGIIKLLQPVMGLFSLG